MIRSSKHTLKFSNKEKLDQLENLWKDFKIDLQHYVTLILNEKLPLKVNLTSKILPVNKIAHSQYRQIIYKQASSVVRGTLESQRAVQKNNKLTLQEVKEIKIDTFSIDLDERLVEFQKSDKEFNEFINLKLPYFYINKKRAIQINLPVKHHKHSKKFKNWERKKTVKLVRDGEKNKFYVLFTYEKPNLEKKVKGQTIGIDQGYKKLISSSKNKHYGKKMFDLYQRISNKKQNSKNFKQLLVERNKKINEICNEFIEDNKDLKTLVLEDLKKVKYKTKIDKRIPSKTVNKLQRWSYRKVTQKLERLSEEKGFLLLKVDPSYTSQRCSDCGSIHKENRNLEVFKCIDCNFETDADFNASVNILQRGEGVLFKTRPSV
jgi:putative transposase